MAFFVGIFLFVIVIGALDRRWVVWPASDGGEN
jgi:hypothetical protein